MSKKKIIAYLLMLSLVCPLVLQTSSKANSIDFSEIENNTGDASEATNTPETTKTPEVTASPEPEYHENEPLIDDTNYPSVSWKTVSRDKQYSTDRGQTIYVETINMDVDGEISKAIVTIGVYVDRETAEEIYNVISVWSNNTNVYIPATYESHQLGLGGISLTKYAPNSPFSHKNLNGDTIETDCVYFYGKEIGVNAFTNAMTGGYSYETVKEIKAPYCINLKSLAIAACPQLETVYLGTKNNETNVLELEPNSLSNNPKLTTVILPDFTSSIPRACFCDDYLLTNFNIPAYIENIEESAFENVICDEYIIPETCTTIGKKAFYNATTSHIVIPNNIESIGLSAFLVKNPSETEIEYNYNNTACRNYEQYDFDGCIKRPYIDITDTTCKPESKSYTYIGKPIIPNIIFSSSTTIPSTMQLTPNINYKVVAENNINVGTASFYVEGLKSNAGISLRGQSKSNTFTITQADIKNADLTLEQNECNYNSVAHIMPVKVSFNGTEISADNYDVTYENNTNVGTAKVTVTGVKNLTGTLTRNFVIKELDLSEATISLSCYEYEYNKTEFKPTVTVMCDGFVITPANYTVEYSNNKQVGKATVTIRGKSNCKGVVMDYFMIVGPSVTTVPNLPTPTPKPKATATPMPTSKPKATATPKPKDSSNSENKATSKPIDVNGNTTTVVPATTLKTEGQNLSNLKLIVKKNKKAKKYQIQTKFNKGKWKTVKTVTKSCKVKIKAGKLTRLRVRGIKGKNKGKWSKVLRINNCTKAFKLPIILK